MSPYRRNILVGATVAGALVVLGWMIIRFGEAPAQLFAPPSIHIRLVAPRTDGLATGSPIQYRGVPVGRVTRVQRSEDGLNVEIHGLVEVHPPLPANLEGVIRSPGLLGGTSILVLSLTEPEPRGELQESAVLLARFVGIDVLPPEFAELAVELRLAAKQVRDSNLIPNLDEQVQKVGQILDSIDEMVADPQLREDVRTAISNVRAATETASRVGQRIEEAAERMSETLGEVRGSISKTNEHMDRLSRQMSDRLTEIAKSLQNLDSITSKIDGGEGTVGQLLNDPKLYESLVDSARELSLTIGDLRRLAEQWEQEGVTFRLR